MENKFYYFSLLIVYSFLIRIEEEFRGVFGGIGRGRRLSCMVYELVNGEGKYGWNVGSGVRGIREGVVRGDG